MNKLMQVKDKEVRDLDKDLTPKQRAFIKRYLETGNGTKAALEVYDTDNVSTAGAIASENLQKLKNPIRMLMESKGLSLGDLIDTVQEARQANKQIGAQILIDKNGQVISKENEGMIEVPDHAVRLKAVEIASKWLGVQGAEEKPLALIQNNYYEKAIDEDRAKYQ